MKARLYPMAYQSRPKPVAASTAISFQPGLLLVSSTSAAESKNGKWETPAT